MSMISNTESGIRIPGMSSRFLDPIGSRDQGQGRLRYLIGGSGAPLVLLHTVRTQAEHFRHLIPLVQQRYTDSLDCRANSSQDGWLTTRHRPHRRPAPRTPRPRGTPRFRWRSG
jgi:hypothetical protein